MSDCIKLLIGRCSFWPEARDPEAWLRALVALSNSAAKSASNAWTSPRAVGDTVLRGHLSRRGVPGLFGLDDSRTPTVLDGVGLLELNADRSTWQLSAEAQSLITIWQTAPHQEAMERLALLLLRRSVWLRLVLLKLQSGTWQLNRWDRLKSSNGQLRIGKHLLLGSDSTPSTWLSELEESALGAWSPELSQEAPVVVQVHAPTTANPDDGLSLSPLKSPLYLLDSLGWLDSIGRLRLPPPNEQDALLNSLAGSKPTASSLLDRLSVAFADHRGVFPVEPVMLRFGQALGLFPHASANDSQFIAWTDRLLSESFRTGAVELLSVEPGQPRHGRGLFGDTHQKLVHWRVHHGFDEICATVVSAFQQPERATAL